MSAVARLPEFLGQVAEGFHIRPYQPSDYAQLMELSRINHEKWHPERERFEFVEPDDPTMLAVVVVADATDRPVAAIAASRVAELFIVIDYERMNLVQMRDTLLPAWPKLASKLYRDGYQTAFARVSSPSPRWPNTLVKRVGFYKSSYPHVYFDLSKAFAGLEKPHD